MSRHVRDESTCEVCPGRRIHSPLEEKGGIIDYCGISISWVGQLVKDHGSKACTVVSDLIPHRI